MPTYSNQAAESTFIYEALATTNYGTDDKLSLGRSAAGEIRRSLIRFPGLPSGVVAVANAKLYLYSSSEVLTTAKDVTVYRVYKNWVEAQATWNRYITGVDWGTAGCGNTTTDHESTAIGTASVSATIAANAEVAISLTASPFIAYLNAQSTYAGAFLLRMVAAEATSEYWNPHSNYAVTSTYRPKLTFDYELGGGGVMFF
jgi:hypothetical protein